MRGDAVQLHHQNSDDVGPLGNVLTDTKEFFYREHVGGFVEERGQVIHARDKRDALDPRAVLHVLFDTGMQVADTTPSVGDGFSIEFQHQTQHAVGGRVLRAHVDDDAFLLPLGCRGYRVPIAAGEVVDRSVESLITIRVDILTRIGRGAVGDVAHQLYALRLSGAGMVAPLYSTGMPPSG